MKKFLGFLGFLGFFLISLSAYATIKCVATVQSVEIHSWRWPWLNCAGDNCAANPIFLNISAPDGKKKRILITGHANRSNLRVNILDPSNQISVGDYTVANTLASSEETLNAASDSVLVGTMTDSANPSAPYFEVRCQIFNSYNQ